LSTNPEVSLTTALTCNDSEGGVDKYAEGGDDHHDVQLTL